MKVKKVFFCDLLKNHIEPDFYFIDDKIIYGFCPYCGKKIFFKRKKEMNDSIEKLKEIVKTEQLEEESLERKIELIWLFLSNGKEKAIITKESFIHEMRSMFGSTK